MNTEFWICTARRRRRSHGRERVKSNKCRRRHRAQFSPCPTFIFPSLSPSSAARSIFFYISPLFTIYFGRQSGAFVPCWKKAAQSYVNFVFAFFLPSLHGCLRAVLDIFYALTCCAVRRKGLHTRTVSKSHNVAVFLLASFLPFSRAHPRFSHIFSPVVSHPLTGICSIQSPLQVSQFSGRARAHVALAGGDLFWGPPHGWKERETWWRRKKDTETSKRRDEGTKETSCNILLFYDDDNKYIGITPKAGIVFWSFFFLSLLFFFVFKAMLLLLFFTPGPDRATRARSLPSTPSQKTLCFLVCDFLMFLRYFFPFLSRIYAYLRWGLSHVLWLYSFLIRNWMFYTLVQCRCWLDSFFSHLGRASTHCGFSQTPLKLCAHTHFMLISYFVSDDVDEVFFKRERGGVREEPRSEIPAKCQRLGKVKNSHQWEYPKFEALVRPRGRRRASIVTRLPFITLIYFFRAVYFDYNQINEQYSIQIICMLMYAVWW